MKKENGQLPSRSILGVRLSPGLPPCSHPFKVSPIHIFIVLCCRFRVPNRGLLLKSPDMLLLAID
jgi:hypothetical protein